MARGRGFAGQTRAMVCSALCTFPGAFSLLGGLKLRFFSFLFLQQARIFTEASDISRENRPVDLFLRCCHTRFGDSDRPGPKGPTLASLVIKALSPFGFFLYRSMPKCDRTSLSLRQKVWPFSGPFRWARPLVEIRIRSERSVAYFFRVS